MTRVALALALLALCSTARSAAACATCDVGDPTITDLALSQPKRGRLRAALDVSHRTVELGDRITGFDLTEQRLTLRGMYSPLARLTLQAELPGVRRQVTRANAARETSYGLGDAFLGAQTLLFRDLAFAPDHALWLNAGVTLPTAPALKERGQSLPLERQTGRGAFAPRLGLTYARFADRWAVFAMLDSELPARCFMDSQPSRSVATQLAGQFQPWPWLALRGGARYLWESRGLEEGGVRDPDSGGQLVAFEGGLSWRPFYPADWAGDRAREFVLRAGVVWPALQWLHGDHHEGPVISAGLLSDF